MAIRWIGVAKVWAWVVVATILTAIPVAAQQPKRHAFDLPDIGEIRPGAERRVKYSEGGKELVARVHVEVGDHFAVVLPNGQLRSVPRGSVEPTSERFVPSSQEEILEAYNQEFEGFKNRKTKNYVYVYNTTEGFAQATQTILETMYPNLKAYTGRMGIESHEPEFPMVVIMFATYEEFNKYRPMPSGVVAYYDTITNHVVMYEKSQLADVDLQLAIRQALATIAHEGVHQILHNIGVQQRLSRWPMWISEGLPEYFSPTDVGKRLRWKGVGQTNDMRMSELEGYFKDKSRETPWGETIEKTVGAQRLTSTGYASAWALVHFLAKKREDQFFAYVQDVSKLGPLEGRARVGEEPLDNMILFKKHFGDDLEDMEKLEVKHLQKLPYVDPFLDWPHFVVYAMLGNRAIAAEVTREPSPSESWKERITEQLPEGQRGQVRYTLMLYRTKREAMRAAGGR